MLKAHATVIASASEAVCPGRHTRHCRHHPRKRVIQYAAAFRFHHHFLWNTGSSAFADDDSGQCGAFVRNDTALTFQTAHHTPPRSRGAMRPSRSEERRVGKE